jgi:hypothetical protein
MEALGFRTALIMVQLVLIAPMAASLMMISFIPLEEEVQARILFGTAAL